MIKYKCVKCGAPMESPDSLVGQTETCPSCGYVCPVRRAAGRRRVLQPAAIVIVLLGVGTALAVWRWIALGDTAKAPEDPQASAHTLGGDDPSQSAAPPPPSSPRFDTPLGTYIGAFRYSGRRLDAKASLNLEDALYRPIEAANLREVVSGSMSARTGEVIVALHFQAAKWNNAKFRFGDFQLRSDSHKDTPMAYSTDLVPGNAWAIGPNVSSERKTPGSTYLWFKAPKSALVAEIVYRSKSAKISLAGARAIPLAPADGDR